MFLLREGSGKLQRESADFLLRETLEGSAYVLKVAALGATAYYRLGEASGTTITDVIGSAHGTYVNTPDLAQTGAVRDGDTAVNFKLASSERGTLTTLGTFGSHIGTCSVAFWIKTTTTTKSAICGVANANLTTAMLIQAASNAAGTQTANATRFFIRNEAGTTTFCHIANSTIYDGNWHFVVGVTDGTVGWKIYVDGLAVTTTSATGNASGTYINLVQPMDIASQNIDGTHQVPFNGALDEVAFFPSRLTADDVINLYFEGATRSTFSPTASGTYYSAVQALTPALYWRLDETATSYYAADASGNGNDGFYLGPDISAGTTGYVDSDKAVRFTNEAGSGVVRALDYSPFQPNAQLTVVGISKWDDVIDPPNGFQNFFSDDSSSGAPNNIGPVLEGGLSSTSNPAAPDSLVRWYTNVAAQFGHNQDFYSNAVPPKGTPARFHWAFVYDDTTLAASFYVNGNLVTSHQGPVGPVTVGFAATTGRFQIANRTRDIISSTENWQGQHDEIAVFERLLTQTEIRTLTAAASIAAFDARAATVSITATGSGVYGYAPDSRSVTAAVTPTRTESHARTVAASIDIPITLSATESWVKFPDTIFTDSGSATVDLTPTRTEANVRLTSGSGTVAVTLTGVESYGFVDAATATAGVTPAGSGIYAYTGAQSVSVALTPAATESYGFVDTGSVAIPVAPTGSGFVFDDSGTAVVAITLSGSAVVFEDAATITVAITPTGSLPPVSFELEELFGQESGHLERDESGHLEFATAGRTT